MAMPTPRHYTLLVIAIQVLCSCSIEDPRPYQIYQFSIHTAGIDEAVISTNPSDLDGASSIQAPGILTYPLDTNVTLTAPTSLQNASFHHWSVDGSSISGNSNELQITATSNHDIVAHYTLDELPYLDITASVSGVTVIINPGNRFYSLPARISAEWDQVIYVTIDEIPRESAFSGWSIDPSGQVDGHEFAVQMTGNHSAHATVNQFDWQLLTNTPAPWGGFASMWGTSLGEIYGAACAAVWRYDGSRWDVSLDTGYCFLGICGTNVTGITEVTAVGVDGMVYTKRGSGSWIDRSIPSTINDLASAWVSGDGIIRAVSRAGPDAARIYRLNDTGFSGEYYSSTRLLNDIWSTSDGHYWAVGVNGTKLRMYADRQWILESSSNTSRDLHAVWGFSSNDIYAAGEDGIIEHWNGSAWSTHAFFGDGTTIYDMWGPSNDRIYAVGSSGGGTYLAFIAKYDGSTWNTLETPVPELISSIWGFNDGSYVVSSRTKELWYYGPPLSR